MKTPENFPFPVVREMHPVTKAEKIWFSHEQPDMAVGSEGDEWLGWVDLQDGGQSYLVPVHVRTKEPALYVGWFSRFFEASGDGPLLEKYRATDYPVADGLLATARMIVEEKMVTPDDLQNTHDLVEDWA